VDGDITIKSRCRSCGMFPGTGKSWMLTAVITACCLLSGCRHSGLSRVERLMENDIEVADSLISAMNKPTGKRGRARYALLKTQIDYKLYRPALNENGIRIATDYYGRDRKSFHAAMAWYSLGCVSAELGRDSTAADAYLTALRLFPDTLVRYYALAQQNLSYIYLEHNMDNEALSMIKAYNTNAVRLKDSVAIAFYEFNIAKSLLYNNEYDSARVMFLKLKDNPWMSSGTKDVPLLQLSIISLCEKQYRQSIDYADSFMVKNQHNIPYGLAYTTKADAYYGLDQLDSALHYYRLSLTDTGDPFTVCNTYRRLAEIHSLKGNRDSATYFTKQASSWTDSIVSASGSDIILRTLLNHSQSQISPKNKLHTLYVILIIIIFVVIITVLLFRHYKNTQNQPQSLSISDFAKDIEDFKKSDLFHFMAETINMHYEPKTKQKNAFIKEFRNSLVRLRTFIATSTKANDDDIDFCIYTMLGFNQKEFSLLFNVEQYRTLKHRLKSKMPESMYNMIFNTENNYDIYNN